MTDQKILRDLFERRPGVSGPGDRARVEYAPNEIAVHTEYGTGYIVVFRFDDEGNLERVSTEV